MGKDDWYFLVGVILAVLSLLGMDWKIVLGRVSVQPSRAREILLLLAIIGSLAFSGVGWYRNGARSRMSSAGWKDEQKSLEPVIHRHFMNEQVELDGKRFENCTFSAVTLVYRGQKNFVLANNAFDKPLVIKVVYGPQSDGLELGSALIQDECMGHMENCNLQGFGFETVDENLQPMSH